MRQYREWNDLTEDTYLNKHQNIPDMLDHLHDGEVWIPISTEDVMTDSTMLS